MNNRNLSGLTSRKAVLDTISEFDKLGREAFLKKYGFGKSHRYFIDHDGRQYDSKAVVGAAFGFQHPSLGPLKSAEFSGGETTVQAKLEELGFTLHILPIVPGRRGPNHACPNCKSENSIPVIYGMPTEDTAHKAQAGLVALGGCCVTGDDLDPNRECRSCRTRWHTRNPNIVITPE